jgi:hypothetical protein
MNSIEYYDSLNHSLRDVVNGTEEQVSQEEKLRPDYKDHKITNQNMQEALVIVQELLKPQKTVQGILVEKRIEDIVGSFNLIKETEAGVDNWLKNDYPKPVL